MKLKFWIIAIVSSMAAGGLSAQATIGSGVKADKAKLLQIENTGGLGLPRVQLVAPATLQPFITGTPTTDEKKAHIGLMVYNLTTTGGFKESVYVWDGESWIQAGAGGKRWFYMPAFNLPLTATGQTTFDLYAEYAEQFTRTGNTHFTSNPLLSTATTVPSPEAGTLYARNELDYAIVNYDPTIITVAGINANGVMTYTVVDNDPGQTSFMTVVFIIK